MKNHDKFNHLAFNFRALRRERQRKNKFIKICSLTKFSCDIFFTNTNISLTLLIKPQINVGDY